MTVRTQLVSGLPGLFLATLQAGTSAFSTIEAGNIYWDTRTRVRRAEKELLLSWGGRNVIGTVTGRRILSSVSLELFLATNDLVHSKDRRYEAAIEQAAQELVEAYDQSESVFETLLTERVNMIRLAEGSSVDIMLPDVDDPRTRYVQTLLMELVTWET